MRTDGGGPVVQHDCSTLGGNSGSAVISLDSGHVLGPHFAGRFAQANRAVKTAVLKDKLTDLGVQVPVQAPLVPPVVTEPDDGGSGTATAEAGYDPAFLGSDAAVPLPALAALGDADVLLGFESVGPREINGSGEVLF